MCDYNTAVTRALQAAQIPVTVGEIMKYNGCPIQKAHKTCFNKVLYAFEKQGIVKKDESTPPKWSLRENHSDSYPIPQCSQVPINQVNCTPVTVTNSFPLQGQEVDERQLLLASLTARMQHMTYEQLKLIESYISS